MRSILVFIIGIVFSLIVYKGEVFAVEKVAGDSGKLAIGQTDNSKREKLAKIRKVKYFLEGYNSPLAGSADVFVEKAEEYNVDWKLVIAIAGVESTFGKRVPANSYNAWGWGIPTGASYGIGFADWKDGINTVSLGLSEKYFARGLADVHAIGAVYAPPSRTWAGNVSFFMEKLDSVVVPPELTI